MHNKKSYCNGKVKDENPSPHLIAHLLIFYFSGLQDQLLALVVMQERPDLEEARSMIVVSSAQMKQELVEIEDRILYKLSASEGSPVDDIDLILTLEASKIKSEEIKVSRFDAQSNRLFFLFLICRDMTFTFFLRKRGAMHVNYFPF